MTDSDEEETEYSVEDELQEFLSIYPAIDINNECSFTDQVRKIDALLSRYMSIPFPEQLDDDTWCEKYRQFQWLLEAGHLPVKLKGNG